MCEVYIGAFWLKANKIASHSNADYLWYKRAVLGFVFSRLFLLNCLYAIYTFIVRPDCVSRYMYMCARCFIDTRRVVGMHSQVYYLISLSEKRSLFGILPN